MGSSCPLGPLDRAFPQLFAWLGEHGVTPSGPPFIRYREVDAEGEPLEIEVAAPVRPSERGSSLPCCVEHYRVGPPMERDWTKWETELAYLVVEP